MGSTRADYHVNGLNFPRTKGSPPISRSWILSCANYSYVRKDMQIAEYYIHGITRNSFLGPGTLGRVGNTNTTNNTNSSTNGNTNSDRNNKLRGSAARLRPIRVDQARREVFFLFQEPHPFCVRANIGRQGTGSFGEELLGFSIVPCRHMPLLVHFCLVESPAGPGGAQTHLEPTYARCRALVSLALTSFVIRVHTSSVPVV